MVRARTWACVRLRTPGCARRSLPLRNWQRRSCSRVPLVFLRDADMQNSYSEYMCKLKIEG